MFDVNSPILYVIVGLIIAVVLGQSVFFLVKAVRRAKAKGMASDVIKKTITSSAVFTIAPAVSILVGVIILSKALGIPLPWLRLSVIGSLSYETIAANNALEALGLDTNTTIASADSFVTVTAVMTIGIIIGLILVPILTPKIQGGMKKIENKDKKWRDIFQNSMFLGMISAFLGFVFCDVGLLWSSNPQIKVDGVLTAVSNTYGLIPVCVFFVSAIAMAILGILSKKTKQRWITDYALPISLIAGMAMAIPLTTWLG